MREPWRVGSSVTIGTFLGGLYGILTGQCIDAVAGFLSVSTIAGGMVGLALAKRVIRPQIVSMAVSVICLSCLWMPIVPLVFGPLVGAAVGCLPLRFRLATFGLLIAFALCVALAPPPPHSWRVFDCLFLRNCGRWPSVWVRATSSRWSLKAKQKLNDASRHAKGVGPWARHKTGLRRGR